MISLQSKKQGLFGLKRITGVPEPNFCEKMRKTVIFLGFLFFLDGHQPNEKGIVGYASIYSHHGPMEFH